MITKCYRLTGLLLLFICATSHAEDYTYTIKLENGSSSDCYISTEQSSRIIIGQEVVELDQFSEESGVYTYEWIGPSSELVAIQVLLSKGNKPDIYTDPDGCIYAPIFGGPHTTFIQQYVEPSNTLPYTCTCTSTWE